MDQRQILVAEDEPAMRLALTEVLSILDEFEILEAADGEQALAMIREHQPELILLDLLMPKLDGFDVLMALQVSGEAVRSKIVVLSALTEPHLVEELAKLGAEAPTDDAPGIDDAPLDDDILSMFEEEEDAGDPLVRDMAAEVEDLDAEDLLSEILSLTEDLESV